MNTNRGYYSLIQFCPDPSRLETVNVGVLLFCPQLSFIAAMTAKGNKRAAKLAASASVIKAGLNSAKRAIERRLEVDREAFQSLEDLQKFVDTRANALKLTKPRPVKVFNPKEDLERLFRELVDDDTPRPTTEQSPPSVPRLDAVFGQLHQQGRARLDVDITVPVLGQTMRVPYAYRNGALNLVMPQRFSTNERPALGAAMKLAIEGDLLFSHGSDDDEVRRLVVVSTFDQDEASREVERRVHEVLSTYNVKTVPDRKLEDFVSEVMKDAH